jgi:cardiolipin synthase
MLIADDKVAVIGGSNIATVYFADDPAGKSWHDLMLVVEGPAAARLALAYDALLEWVDGDNGTLTGLNRVLRDASEHAGALRWVMGGPFRRLNPLVRALKHDIDHATQVDMIQAYFAPNWGFLRKLGHVARRGRFRLITASRSDNVTTVSAARHCYRRLFHYGAEIMEYGPQMLHAKLVIADDAVWLGSANFDIRSLYLNTELALRIEDAGFAAAMRALFDQYQPWCATVTEESHKRNSPPIARFVRFLSYTIVATVDFRLTRRFTLPGRK